MTFPMNDDLAERELSASELDAISAGLVPHGPLPPIRAPRIINRTRRRAIILAAARMRPACRSITEGRTYG